MKFGSKFFFILSIMLGAAFLVQIYLGIKSMVYICLGAAIGSLLRGFYEQSKEMKNKTP